MTLWRPHAQMVGDSSSNSKIDHVTHIEDILNSEGHQICIIGLKAISILLHMWILPVCGLASVKGCGQSAKKDFFSAIGAYI